MSIIQVMDSTKSGRAIYVVASSIATLALVGIILRLQGAEIEFTVESLVVLVPIIGGLSLLFLSIKLEKIVVEQVSLHRINGMKERDDTKLQMAVALLYIAPWESSPKEASAIDESLSFDLKRMLRSPQFSEQISELQQVFWILVLLPFTVIDIILLYSMDWLIIGAVTVLGLVSAILILWRNRRVLNRILSYAYASWFLEGTSADLEWRKAGVRMDQIHKDRLDASLELTKPVIDLAVKGDWEGFDRKSRNLDDLVGIPSYDSLHWGMIERYILFLDWCAKTIHGIHASHIDIFLKNGLTQITSAISVFEETRKQQFTAEEQMVAEMLQTITKLTKDKDTFLNIDIGFYEQIDKASFENLTSGYLDKLGEIPFRLQQMSPPNVKSDVGGIDRLSWLVANAAEKELLDIQRSLSVVASWRTHPTTVLSATGSLAVKTLLEDDVGFSIDQLLSVAPTIRERVKQDDRTNPNKVIKHLYELKKNYPRSLVRKYAIAIQWDTIRSPNEELHSGIEAITRFIDDFDK
ncbi:MAG: hypothetical protein ACFFER_13875 [Candidatus Thorarchaeota archaeon]